MMNPTPRERDAGRENFQLSRRGFLGASVAAGAVAGGSLGGFYFGYSAAQPDPIRVGVIGTGDEGSVLLGAINPNFLQVTCIADIRPYNVHRAFHGDQFGEVAMKARPGLMKVYDWKTETEARKHVAVYSDYRELIDAEKHNLDGVIIALPLHLHAPAAIAAMKAGLHVLTEKLMGHSVHECKEMARVAKTQKVHLATGHQRHYNILYHEAMDSIQRGVLGDLHYIRAQWHRGNLPGKDSWQQPLPPGAKPDDPLAKSLVAKLDSLKKQFTKALGRDIDAMRKQIAQLEAQLADVALTEKGKDGKTLAERYGYEPVRLLGADGQPVYQGPAIEELIRWRLWDRTGGGLMVELGSHQLDAASLFISAMHGGKKQHPLRVMAASSRPLFPPDRDADDHVACIYEFPAPGYDAKDPNRAKKKIGVQYASINGNGFGGYGEIVYGTKGTLILEREEDVMLYTDASKSQIKASPSGGPALDTQASGPAQTAVAGEKRVVSRGYREELEHWAWCIKNPAPENLPHCHPKVALADATIALVTNLSAKQGKPIAFDEAWFDPDSDATPEGVKPDVGRYA